MPDHEGANLWALDDLCTPWCIRVVATLRIADHIAAGIDQIDDLAAVAGCDAYALHRTLTYLVGVVRGLDRIATSIDGCPEPQRQQPMSISGPPPSTYL
jgi:hypothetical protein